LEKKDFDVGFSVKVHHRERGFDFHFPHYMNEENKINFAYIAGKNHGRVDISEQQLNQVMKIIYGDEKV